LRRTALQHWLKGARVHTKFSSKEVAELWRQRARETRASAARFSHGSEEQSRLLKIACVYDAMAQRVDQEEIRDRLPARKRH